MHFSSAMQEFGLIRGNSFHPRGSRIYLGVTSPDLNFFAPLVITNHFWPHAWLPSDWRLLACDASEKVIGKQVHVIGSMVKDVNVITQVGRTKIRTTLNGENPCFNDDGSFRSDVCEQVDRMLTVQPEDVTAIGPWEVPMWRNEDEKRIELRYYYILNVRIRFPGLETVYIAMVVDAVTGEVLFELLKELEWNIWKNQSSSRSGGTGGNPWKDSQPPPSGELVVPCPTSS